ncbi:MAG: rod shape-determining protein MreC [bacterium]|nr:rod shape-determining protein MreC [bacterium]
MFKSQRFLLTIAGILLLVIFGLAGFFQPFRSLAQRATLPFVRGTSGFLSSAGLGVSRLFAGSTESKRLEDLERRLSKLSIDYTRLQALEEENAGLRAQAKFLTTTGYDSVGARVISREITQGRSTLLVDRGSRDGIELGEAAITNNGVFIGKVASMTERVATIELLTDPNSRVASAIAGDGKLIGVLEGRGNGAAVLTYIPSSENLKRDQIVVTAGTENKVPGHLPLGIINDVQGKAADPFLTAAVESLATADQILFLSILRPSALKPN